MLNFIRSKNNLFNLNSKKYKNFKFTIINNAIKPKTSLIKATKPNSNNKIYQTKFSIFNINNPMCTMYNFLFLNKKQFTSNTNTNQAKPNPELEDFLKNFESDLQQAQTLSTEL